MWLSRDDINYFVGILTLIFVWHCLNFWNMFHISVNFRKTSCGYYYLFFKITFDGFRNNGFDNYMLLDFHKIFYISKIYICAVEYFFVIPDLWYRYHILNSIFRTWREHKFLSHWTKKSFYVKKYNRTCQSDRVSPHISVWYYAHFRMCVSPFKKEMSI